MPRGPVHPHACGEQPAGRVRGAALNGSSPRVWGTDEADVDGATRTRFIPTRVGNRRLRRRGTRRTPVHPHACGEQSWKPARPSTVVGSSPRVWGTDRQGIPQAGFVPVHPHACGEQHDSRDGKTYSNGSSPRVWGTVVEPGAVHDAHRFIPTRVGNSHGSGLSHPSTAVHPHACGEQDQEPRPEVEDCGSSPRVWGTGAVRKLQALHRRFIPTRVGNSPSSGLRRPARPVHPHACGEQWAANECELVGYGSSPRVWGTATGW